MPRAIDLSTVTPERAAQILKSRADKAREYERKRELILARHREWREKNQDKTRELGRQWRLENPERASENKKNWYESNRDLVLSRASERYENLSTPGVIRTCFAASASREGLKAKDCPDEMLPLVRVTMLIKREIKRKKGTP